MNHLDLGSCPICDTPIRTSTCVECEANLELLLEARRLAWKLSKEVALMTRQGRVEEAVHLARDAAFLHPTRRVLALLGWVEFLRGDLARALDVWEELPSDARRLANRFNGALAQARAGDWAAAIQSLESIDAPFLPALHLRFIAQAEDGRLDEANLTRLEATRCFPMSTELPAIDLEVTASGQHGPRVGKNSTTVWPLYVAGAVLFGAVIGAGGMSMWGPPPPESAPAPTAASAEEGPPVSSEETSRTEETPPAASAASLALSILQRDAGALSSAAEVGSDPLDSLSIVPTATRQALSLEWYRRGTSSGGSPSSFQEPWLRGSLLMVGAASEHYWVDDALYSLLEIEWEEGNEGEAERLAQMIREHHSDGMFNNSVVRDIVNSEER